MKVFKPSRLLLLLVFVLVSTLQAADMNFLIMPAAVIGPISPYVYGLNDQDPGDTHATVRRLGGNRMTGYNWVNNASNAGTDWHNISDDWFCAQHFKDADCDQPGSMVKQFVTENQKDGMDSLITLPMAGFVAADTSGEVTADQTAPGPRWDKVVFRKGSPFTLVPNPKSKTVYDDEFVNFLVTNFHPAAQGGVKFYALDNGPRPIPESTRPKPLIWKW
jgi:mannan endo-1,4-beta-mannosidase